jgi:putative membrane protein
MTKRLLAGFSLFLLTSLGPLSAQTGTQQQDPNTGTQSGTPAGSDSSMGNPAGSSSTAGASDSQFVQKAAQSGLAEVELGRLASQKAESPEVKQFGEQMVTDHMQANQQLKQAASGMNVPDSIDPEHQALKDKLSGLSGKEFDREYMRSQLKDHQEAVSLFRSQSDNGQGQLKTFASTTLPKIEEHARMAREIASKLGISDLALGTDNQSGDMSSADSSTTAADTSGVTGSGTAQSSSSTDQTGTPAGGVSPERHDRTYDRSSEMTNNNLDQFGNDRNRQDQSSSTAPSTSSTDATGSTTSRSDTGNTTSSATTGTSDSTTGTTGSMSSTQDQQSPANSTSSSGSTSTDTTTNSTGTTGTAAGTDLPRTASPVPLIGLLGLLSIGAASILGLRRRMN